MALLCSYTCIPYYPLLYYSDYDRVCVEACIGLSYKALGRFLLGFGSSSSPEKIVSVMIGSLEESAVFSTICFSGSIIANAVESLAKSCDKCASLRTTYSRIRESRSHSRLGSYEGQNKDWYRLEKKEEEEDSSNSGTRRRPAVLPLLGVLGSLIGGTAGVAKAVNDSKTAQRQLEDLQRHNHVMEGRGVYLAPYKRGQGVHDRVIEYCLLSNVVRKIM
ncbi:hypothetical protein ALC57_01408 [Trachymyrmex cornetzi]|uniref:Uncharacterized protein n=1 Tax=Trachymyrmex cornetzi TaxID=471704 RepID=A0A151JQ88_9HYME|nr:hypothetical protein ALC57_01408 [Trachymyrmex cornetzi]